MRRAAPFIGLTALAGLALLIMWFLDGSDRNQSAGRFQAIATATTAPPPARLPPLSTFPPLPQVTLPVPLGTVTARPPATLSLPEAQATSAALVAQATQAAYEREHAPTPTPQPPPPPSILIVQDARALGATPGFRGPPPFAVPLVGFIIADPRNPVTCVSWHWEWGDGTTEDVPCTQLPQTGWGSQPGVIVRHVYAQNGSYDISTRVTLSNGQVEARPGPQIFVAAALPVPEDHTQRNWILWGAALLVALAALVALFRVRRVRRWRRLGAAVVLLAVWTYLPPFSFVPNPLGLLWNLAGGYTYWPDLPFGNRFVIADDPTGTLAGGLETLIGQTGLDPLDPVHPLIGYEFGQVSQVSRYETLVHTRLIYADGTSRAYDLPAYADHSYYRAGWSRSWFFDTLGRARADQRDLGLGRAGGVAPVVGPPIRLALPPIAEQLDVRSAANWILPGFDEAAFRQRLLVAPGGDAFLVSAATSRFSPERDLWLVRLDGAAPTRLARATLDYAWTPDGQQVVYVTRENGNPVSVVNRDGSGARVLARPGLPTLPGITADGIWTLADGAVRITAFAGGDRPGPALIGPALANPLRPSPDGGAVAYHCGDAWCVEDVAGGHRVTVQGGGNTLAWSPDGQKFALAEPEVLVYSRAGRGLGIISVFSTHLPNQFQWSPDSRILYAAVFPEFNSRRLLALDSQTAAVWDLTVPHWDPWFALWPDGGSLLLANGRGGFWRAPLQVGAATR
jgi:hypothetical protein